jgi:opacity protein-like surface antigen
MVTDLGRRNCAASSLRRAEQRANCQRITICSALFLVGCLAGMSASAADERRHVNNVEITPFIGYMGGGKFENPTDQSDRNLEDDTAFGLFVDIVADVPERHYELLYANQSSTVDGGVPIDMKVQYLHLGGTVSYTDTSAHVIPYFGGTIGAARFSPDASGLGDETKLSFSFGGGLKVPFTDHVGLRLDARAFISLLDSDSVLFCSSGSEGGACAISARSDTFVQYSAGLGIVAAF